MRWLIIIGLLLAAWYFMSRERPEPEPMPLEDTFMAEPARALGEAEAMNDRHLEQAEERQRRLEEAVDEPVVGQLMGRDIDRHGDRRRPSPSRSRDRARPRLHPRLGGCRRHPDFATRHQDPHHC